MAPPDDIALHSFDVFDTLLTRCWWRPEDLFLRLGARLAEAGLLRAAPADFAARRIAAEAGLRARPGVEEVTLAEIHAELAGSFGWTAEQTAVAAALELDAEEEAIRPIAANARLLAGLQRQGADVALLSDTYLDRAALMRLLRRAGITVPEDRIFASSALGATKRSGRLFGLVAERLGVPPQRIAHRGDHPHSDLAVPRAAGLVAQRCLIGVPSRFEAVLHQATARQPEMLRSALAGAARAARLSVDPPTPHARALWSVGADVAGPLLAGFVLWVVLEARRAGLRRLHFVSRDGQILLRIAEMLLGRLGWGIECRYLLGSRQAWHLPAMERLDDAALDWLAKEAPGEPLRSVLARAELAPERIAGALARHGLDGLDAPAPTSRLIALLRDAEVDGALLEAAAERRRLALGYLRQEGLLDGGPAAMVDLGWHGRLQRSLRRLLELGATDGRTPPLTGFYLALRNRPEGFAAAEMRTFVDSPDFLHRMNPVLFEIFCAADHGTVRRYVARPDGGFAAELAESADRRALAWGLRTLQDGILAFAAELAEALRRSSGADAADWCEVLRAGGLAAYDAFRRDPSAEEAEAFGSFPHADGQAHEVWSDCAPRIGPAMRLRLGLGLGASGYAGHWPEASLR
ncbi:HAD family hydrolase, partial [Falsiroseomonas oryzae]|uniref:HAD family hydrolase n=1 Tax=Falsiroseomonas oryzae TaxID=2766473 RepID=UPI0022EB0658